MKSQKRYCCSLAAAALSLFILATEPLAYADDTSLAPEATATVAVTTPASTETASTEASSASATETETPAVESSSTPTASTEISSDSSSTETNAISETTVASTTTEEAKPVIPMPSGLVGTWTGNASSALGYTFVFNADGTGQRIIHTDQGDEVVTFRIDSVQLVGENTYRFVAGENTYEIAETGFGGHGVKYQNGFYLAGDTFSPIMWQTPADQDFDYSKGERSQILYIREVPQSELNTEEATSQMTVIKKAAVPASATSNVKALPQTGEAASLALLPILGLSLISLPFLKKFAKQ
ncbi:hypothetical protein ACVR05_09335 [Streptococcus caprae]|uniref:LPXTG cell wall anchor domain-containing protein n=1 Tax=Streptococcus caprae TaxID=1640501 RepID=A0ABV8CSS9_9STRE